MVVGWEKVDGWSVRQVGYVDKAGRQIDRCCKWSLSY